MRKIVLYIATSLDGFIAGKNNDMSWLQGDGSDNDNMGSYPEFIESIDTVILGYTTYNLIVTELAPNNWPYKGMTSYVITNKNLNDEKEIKFTSDLKGLLEKLKKEDGKDIWICGGANIANQLLKLDLIDKIILSIIPKILGGGVKLFEEGIPEKNLKLISTKTYNGITDLVYERR